MLQLCDNGIGFVDRAYIEWYRAQKGREDVMNLPGTSAILMLLEFKPSRNGMLIEETSQAELLGRTKGSIRVL